MTDSRAREAAFSTERTKAFVDAVVAIAMTLLILPLMESVGEAGDATTSSWLADHDEQLLSFVISFLVIAVFWLNHHRLFARVTSITTGLMWMTVAWMLTIVWLPVATAITGQMSDTGAEAMYIGTMVLTPTIALISRLYLRRRPELHDLSDAEQQSGIIENVAAVALFAVALVVAVTLPGVGYYALFVLFLAAPVQRMLRAAVRHRG
ncbi:TMEM175 family protein [Gordonia humi]|uniref:Putative membrane protein n=1 Tax=Gordonia humi TaxID=686429 RepID=A0A840ENT5_9ACTN|nr:TMEM175 family protein [Gordonia humi]MBB4134475.1 putative membrane protein [Gordonia humi]